MRVTLISTSKFQEKPRTIAGTIRLFRATILNRTMQGRTVVTAVRSFFKIFFKQQEVGLFLHSTLYRT